MPFFQFSTDFTETLSKCFFFQGRLNETFKSELTLLFFHSFQGGTKGKKLKNQKKQKKCSQMCSQAFLCISPFKTHAGQTQKLLGKFFNDYIFVIRGFKIHYINGLVAFNYRNQLLHICQFKPTISYIPLPISEGYRQSGAKSRN